MSHSDVLIIGSGISSLTCAVLLARQGKKVTVLEQYLKPGGYLHCFKRFGERYDTGAHYVGAMDPGHPFHTLLTNLGVFDENLFTPLDPDGFDVFHFPEFQWAMPKGYSEVRRRLCDLFPQEKNAIEKYLAIVQESVRAFPTYEFNDASMEIPDARIFETSLAQVVSGLTSNQRLQCVLYAYCTLHGVQPEEVPFGFHAIVTDSLIRSPYGLKNGGDALADNFVRVLKNHGGELHTRKKVVRLEVVDRQIRSVQTDDGETFSADWVIAGIHPRNVMRMFNDESQSFSPVFRNRVEGLQETVGLFGISALAHQCQLNPLKNYFFFRSSDPKSFLKVAGPLDPPQAIFMSPALRQATVNSLMPLNLHSAASSVWFEPWKGERYGLRSPAYKDLKSQISKNIFLGVDEFLPGFAASIESFVASTPLTNLHFNGSPQGSAYGLYHSIQNTGPRAIGPRTKILNLLLTGQNTLFPGLLGASISGVRTAGHVIGIKPLLSELKGLSSRLQGTPSVEVFG